MKAIYGLLLLWTGLVRASTLTLPGPVPLELDINDINGMSGAQQQQLEQQLQQSLTQYLQQQWPLLQDEQYWPLAEAFAQSGQWPAHAELLQQAWQQCEAWWQQQRSYHCRFGAARKLWQEQNASGLPDRVQLRREARQITGQTGTDIRLLPDLQGFAQAVLLDNLLAKVRTQWPQAGLRLRFGDWQAQFGAAAADVIAFGAPGKQDQHPLTTIRLQQQVLLQANGSTRSQKFGRRLVSGRSLAGAIWPGGRGTQPEFQPRLVTGTGAGVGQPNTAPAMVVRGKGRSTLARMATRPGSPCQVSGFSALVSAPAER
ncbi:MAG: hypothetical protein U5L02_04235 [Rheinheimera sp.]|nr:hypothetical protein [Rheinheimera sp.]